MTLAGIARRTTRVAKRRRRSELGLLFVGGIVILFGALLLSLGMTNALPDHAIELIIGLVVIGVVVQIANRRLVPEADSLLLPVALVLNGIGYLVIERITAGSPNNPNYHNDPIQQLAWTALGIVLYIVVLCVVKRSRDLERYRYLLALVAFVLLVAPLVPHFGENVGGARLWVHVSSIEFQPVEIAKLLLVIFFASYVVEKRELLTIPTRRVGNRLLPDLRAFGPIVVATAVGLLIILGEHDIGFSLILFVVFLTMIWVTTGRWTYVVIGLVLFAVVTFLASHLLGQVNSRIVDWLDPWKYYAAQGGGYQPVQGELALGRGGWFGTGLGLGTGAVTIPVAQSDFIFAVIGEELGLVGTIAVAVGFLVMVISGLRAAMRARSQFAKLVAVGLAATLGFQAFFIMAGVVRLLPLTGVTLPFVSYGGSSLVANYILLALLMRISDEGNQTLSSSDDAARGSSSGSRTPASASTRAEATSGTKRR